MKIHFSLNGKNKEFDGDKDMPLLWYLRDIAKLRGTKFGCGIGECGACTVHINGRSARSCSVPLMAVQDKSITTIEGLAGDTLHPVQQAWIEQDVSQCGYCQAGQIMAAAELLQRIPTPNDNDINSISNFCRCGTYPRIRKAIHRAADLQHENMSPKESKST
jgi:isoquinoline 1-oxidoreductase subunit alpha